MLDKKEFEAALLDALSTSTSVLRAGDVHVVQADGELVIAFHDLRAARRAHHTLTELKDGPFLALLHTQPPVHYLTPAEASQVSGRSLVLSGSLMSPRNSATRRSLPTWTAASIYLPRSSDTHGRRASLARSTFAP